MIRLALAVAVLGLVSCRAPVVPAGGSAPTPGTPGAANLAFTCRPPRPTCENPGYTIAVLGDRVAKCELQAAGTALRLTLESSNQPGNSVVVALDGYHGQGSYSLDDPASRYLAVDDGVDFAGCGGTIQVGKRVTAADPNCGSPACSVRVDDASPGAAFPKPLVFTVSCASLCENGSDVTCQGPMNFVTRADCT